MGNNKRDLKREYKESERPMGIYQILNTANGKMLIGQSVNLPGIINRERFALNAGGHMNKQLQADWNTHGADSFVFEILEELKPAEGGDIKADLNLLEEMWLDTLNPFNERGYNQRKKTAGEKLDQMVRNRSQKPTDLAED